MSELEQDVVASDAVAELAQPAEVTPIDRATATAAWNEVIVGQAARKIAQVIDEPGSFDDHIDLLGGSDLLSVVAYIGEVRGFDVRPPRASERAELTIDRLARASSLRIRRIKLKAGWSKLANEAFLGYTEDGTPVALIPHRGSYLYRRASDPKPRPYDEVKMPLREVAVEIYPPLPRHRAATTRDVVRLALRGNSRTVAIILLCALGVALLTMATPAITNTVLNVLVPQGSVRSIVASGIVLVLFALAAGAFVIVENFGISKLTQIAQLRTESALWDRTLSLPLTFFRQFSSGDLGYRLIAFDSLKDILNSQTVTALLAAVFSIVNFYLLFTYSILLAVIAMVVVFISAFLTWRLMKSYAGLARRSNAAQRATTSWFVQMINGISKLRIAGAEDRFTAITLMHQSEQIQAQSAQTLLIGRLQSLMAAVSAIAPMAFIFAVGTYMWSATGSTIDPATYIAFSTAFGTVLGALIGLSSVAPAIASAAPYIEVVQPILRATVDEPEDAQVLEHIRGAVEFRNVSFRYGPNMPMVLNDLSFSVPAGGTIALVGPSGCGKSSAVRLITGLEQPTEGQIFIDGYDVATLDGGELRQHIGIVLQGGKLSPGSILENIAAGSDLSEYDAWMAAGAAQVHVDILMMPMKMHTVVSPLTLSGGQTQRILIARALARKPRILIMDEATSALDNESQAGVSDYLDNLDITRILIAHRLSTIQKADQIVVMEHGRAVEIGDYDTLMELDGLFAALARRQLAS
jgi:NHLM bacteriocin system ABC transporter ATP-binding protein